MSVFPAMLFGENSELNPEKIIFIVMDLFETSGISTTIRRTATREAGISRHHESTVEGHPETPRI